jgi:hypothetical protein
MGIAGTGCGEAPTSGLARITDEFEDPVVAELETSVGLVVAVAATTTQICPIEKHMLSG